MNQRQSKVTTEKIWRELSDRLRQFIRSRVACSADVDDILQTVFLRIHQNFDALRRKERMESWVFQIARNAIADNFRNQRNSPNEAAPQVAVTEPPTEDNLNREAASCIAALIDHLPEDYKRAVSLYELEGLTQADIANRESISLSGAKSRIQRGRRKLEEILFECCKFQFDLRGNVLECEAVNHECATVCDDKLSGR